MFGWIPLPAKSQSDVTWAIPQMLLTQESCVTAKDYRAWESCFL